MRGFVVDTNVLVVASTRNEQADPECVIACINALKEIRDNGIVVLDACGLILREYRRQLNLSGQPGLGDLFMKWVWHIQADEQRCEQVAVTPQNGDCNNLAEFPNDPDLARFDPSDRKFVAVALRSANQPDVLNAVDSDWAEHIVALNRHGVRVRFLCPQHVCPAPTM